MEGAIWQGMWVAPYWQPARNKGLPPYNSRSWVIPTTRMRWTWIPPPPSPLLSSVSRWESMGNTLISACDAENSSTRRWVSDLQNFELTSGCDYKLLNLLRSNRKQIRLSLALVCFILVASQVRRKHDLLFLFVFTSYVHFKVIHSVLSVKGKCSQFICRKRWLWSLKLVND